MPNTFGSFFDYLKPLTPEELQEAQIVTDYQDKSKTGGPEDITIEPSLKKQYEAGAGARKFIKYGIIPTSLLIVGLLTYVGLKNSKGVVPDPIIQKNLQDTLMIDSVDTQKIKEYRKTLPEDIQEEFDQFLPDEQSSHVKDELQKENNK